MSDAGNPWTQRRTEERVEAALVVRYRFAGREEFVERYSKNISPSGIFIATDQRHAPGTELSFEIQSQDGGPIFRGKGVVRWSREGDPATQRAGGVGVQFTELDEGNRALVARVVEGVASSAAVRPAPPGMVRAGVPLRLESSAPAPSSPPSPGSPPAWSAPASASQGMAPDETPSTTPEEIPQPPREGTTRARPPTDVVSATLPKVGPSHGIRAVVVSVCALLVGGGGLWVWEHGTPLAPGEPRSSMERPAPRPIPVQAAAPLSPQGGSPGPAAIASTGLVAPSVSSPSPAKAPEPVARVEAPPAPSAAPAPPAPSAAPALPAPTLPASAHPPNRRSPHRQAVAAAESREHAPAQDSPPHLQQDIPMPPPPGALMDEMIRRTLNKQRALAQLCYERALKQNQNLKGRVTLELTVSEERVSGISVVENTVSEWSVATCLKDRMRGMTFPGVHEEITLNVPFDLRPMDLPSAASASRP